MSAHNHKPMMVWTLRNIASGNIVTVVLPEGFIPNQDWEFMDVQNLNPREDSISS